MDKDNLTFEEARIEGTKRLERFVHYVFGEGVEVVNVIDSPGSADSPTENPHNTAA